MTDFIQLFTFIMAVAFVYFYYFADSIVQRYNIKPRTYFVLSFFFGGIYGSCLFRLVLAHLGLL